MTAVALAAGPVSAARPAGSAGPAGPVASGAPSAQDEPPVLAYESVCFGLCAWFWPAGLPETAVYADGTVVHYEFDDGNPGTLEMFRGRIDDAAVTKLLDLGARARLVGGGVIDVPLPPGIQIYDGGGVTFTSVIDGVRSVRNLDHLYASSDFNQQGARAQYLALLDALARAGEVATEPVAIEQWAVIARWPSNGGGGPVLDLPPGDWALEETDGVGPCVVVTADWPLTTDQTMPRPTVDVGGISSEVIRRPLLPHEHTCADLAQ